MGKPKSRFVCQECGAIAVKWQGKCPDCGNWNTFIEELAAPLPAKGLFPAARGEPELLKEIETSLETRMLTHIEEFDRVLGGGLVPGSVVLVGGPPGIGKSTLLLQLAHGVSTKTGTVLYVTGEESSAQVKLRSVRLQIAPDNIYILPEVNLESIAAQIEAIKPVLVLVDSIQTIYRPELDGAPGSVTQVRECAAALVRIAKSIGITLVIVGHVTKDGMLAGPRVLEHLVDTVLSFEGEGIQNFRIIKSVKNRFGSTNEVGIFEMGSLGLRGLKNPSAYFLAQRSRAVAGSIIIPVMEGTRAILVELQALVAKANYAVPTRRAKGIDINRLALVIAVLEKRASLGLGASDVFVNVVGGMEIDEPAVDLGLALAIASSLKNKPLRPGLVAFGEVGLGGEIRGASHSDRRIIEAERLGFKECLLSPHNLNADSPMPSSIKLHAVELIRGGIEKALE
ncbi:MAG: DNA repair protein RadA [Candidatus Eremiobacteraeota bacterium]|nr:DNA repair protein RadA [Candidatus Eremiobacteraeota bacterium]